MIYSNRKTDKTMISNTYKAALTILLLSGCGLDGGEQASSSEQDGSYGDGSSTADVAEETCAPQALVAVSADFFTDISESSGIRVGNFAPDPVEGTAINDHSRLAFADITGDGWDDIVMHSLYPNPQAGVPFEHLVFRNKGDGTFEDISDASGLREDRREHDEELLAS